MEMAIETGSPRVCEQSIAIPLCPFSRITPCGSSHNSLCPIALEDHPAWGAGTSMPAGRFERITLGGSVGAEAI